MDKDFEGLCDRSNDSQQQQDMDAQLFAVTEILGIIDKSPLLNTGQKLLLYWACGVPVPNPPEGQMAMWDPDSEQPPF